MKKSELKQLIREVIEQVNSQEDPSVQIAKEIITYLDKVDFVEDIDIDYLKKMAQSIIDVNKNGNKAPGLKSSHPDYADDDEIVRNLVDMGR